MKEIFLLLVIFHIKHFLADYPLQGKYMLGKFKTGKEWIIPLAAHAGVHFLFTFFIVFVFQDLTKAFWLATIDFIVHFVVDRIKASPNLLGRWKPDNAKFWLALGGDQMAHHLCHYLIIWLMLN